MVSPDLDQLRLTTREALLSRTLSHPHLVQTYAITLTQLSEADLAPDTHAPPRPPAAPAPHASLPAGALSAATASLAGGVAVTCLSDDDESSHNISALLATAPQSLIAVTEECVSPPAARPDTSGRISSSLMRLRPLSASALLPQVRPKPAGGSAACCMPDDALGGGGGGGSSSNAAAAAQAASTAAELAAGRTASCCAQQQQAASRRGCVPTGFEAVVSPQSALGGPLLCALQCEVSFATPAATPGGSPVAPQHYYGGDAVGARDAAEFCRRSVSASEADRSTLANPPQQQALEAPAVVGARDTLRLARRGSLDGAAPGANNQAQVAHAYASAQRRAPTDEPMAQLHPAAGRNGEGAHRNALRLLHELQLLGAAPGHFLTCVIMEYCERGNLLQLIEEQELLGLMAATAGGGFMCGLSSAPAASGGLPGSAAARGTGGSRHRRSLLPQVTSLSCNTITPAATGTGFRSGAWPSVASATSGTQVLAAVGFHSCVMDAPGPASDCPAGQPQHAQPMVSPSFGRSTTETLLGARDSRDGNQALRQSVASVAAAGPDSMASTWEHSGSSLRVAAGAQQQPSSLLLRPQPGLPQQAAAGEALGSSGRHRYNSGASSSTRSLELLRTALEVAQAMAYLHSLDLVHGDLKPANVLLRAAAPAGEDDANHAIPAGSLAPPTTRAMAPTGVHVSPVSAQAAGVAVGMLTAYPAAGGGGGLQLPPPAGAEDSSAQGPASHRSGGGLCGGPADAGPPQPQPQPERGRRYICKVADFGLTNPVAATEQHILRSPAAAGGPPGELLPRNADCGAVPYLAPEIIVRGSGGKPADVYSYGALLWHMCSGVPPHSQLHPAQILVGLAGGELQLEWPADAEPTLRKIGAACLQHNPAARPSFDRIVRALLKAVDRTIARSRSRAFAAPGAAAAAAAAAAGSSPYATAQQPPMQHLASRAAQQPQAAMPPAAAAEWQQPQQPQQQQQEVGLVQQPPRPRPRPQSQQAIPSQAFPQPHLPLGASTQAQCSRKAGSESVLGATTTTVVAVAAAASSAAATAAAQRQGGPSPAAVAAGSSPPSPTPYGLMPAVYRQWIPPEAFLVSTGGGRDSWRDQNYEGGASCTSNSSSSALTLLLQSGRYAGVGGGDGGVSFEAGSLSIAAQAAAAAATAAAAAAAAIGSEQQRTWTAGRPVASAGHAT